MSTVFHVLYIQIHRNTVRFSTIGTQLKPTLRPPQTIVTADHPWSWVRATRFCISREITAATLVNRDVGSSLIPSCSCIRARCRKHRLHLPASLLRWYPVIVRCEMYFVCSLRNCYNGQLSSRAIIFAKCKVRSDEHRNAHCCGWSPLWCNRRFVSSIKIKTIWAEALTPKHEVNAKIHRVESLLLFPRRDVKALECSGWTWKLRSHGTM